MAAKTKIIASYVDEESVEMIPRPGVKWEIRHSPKLVRRYVDGTDLSPYKVVCFDDGRLAVEGG